MKIITEVVFPRELTGGQLLTEAQYNAPRHGCQALRADCAKLVICLLSWLPLTLCSRRPVLRSIADLRHGAPSAPRLLLNQQPPSRPANGAQAAPSFSSGSSRWPASRLPFVSTALAIFPRASTMMRRSTARTRCSWSRFRLVVGRSFFTGNFGREPLLNYLLALAQAVAGPSALTLRFFPAAIGALLTPALVWLGWEMAPGLRADRGRLALWSGAAVLALLWSQIFARFVLRVEFLALLLTVFLCRAVSGLADTKAALVYGCRGRCRALVLHLSPESPSSPGAAAGWPAHGVQIPPALRARRAGVLTPGFRRSIVIAAAGRATSLLTRPAFSQRAGQVSVLDDPALLLHNMVVVAKMFFFAGDQNPRNNIPGRPARSTVLLAGPFLIGLAGRPVASRCVRSPCCCSHGSPCVASDGAQRGRAVVSARNGALPLSPCS